MEILIVLLVGASIIMIVVSVIVSIAALVRIVMPERGEES